MNVTTSVYNNQPAVWDKKTAHLPNKEGALRVAVVTRAESSTHQHTLGAPVLSAAMLGNTATTPSTGSEPYPVTSSTSPPAKRAKLVGYDNFVRHNPLSDRFEVRRFHHLEILCGDAKTTANHFCTALGCIPVAVSNMMSGNCVYASHVVASGSLTIACTAPYGDGAAAANKTAKPPPNPAFVPADARALFALHGLHVTAVGVEVGDAAHAYERAVSGGATAASPPHTDRETGVVTAEVRLYPDGDSVLRFVSGERLAELPFLPGYKKVVLPPGARGGSYGIERIDHVVGNVPDLIGAVDYIMGFTGFHEFAEFTAEDVGTVDSGLNSMVIASNNEAVLLPVNEPTTGGKRKSQILTYLEQHGGPGVQHIALKTDDIFATVAAMRAAHAAYGGFDLMERPRDQYYDRLHERLGEGTLSTDQADKCRELGILADKDDQGVLLQIFTKVSALRAPPPCARHDSAPSKARVQAPGPCSPWAPSSSLAGLKMPEYAPGHERPLAHARSRMRGGGCPEKPARTRHPGNPVVRSRSHAAASAHLCAQPIADRSTLFLEIIQRVGCDKDPATNCMIAQKPGCGGFGKGNFHELFRAIEEYETRAGINKIDK